jgi:hypothetical protein
LKVKAQSKAVYNHDSFARDLRGAVRGYWTGAIDGFAFFESFLVTIERGLTAAIERGLTAAWYDGAAACGILPEELTVAETKELRFRIAQQTNFINGFAEDIERGSKANGGKLTPLMQRVQLWVNRWNDVRNEAQVMACKDQKLMWELGATEKHCKTCFALNGKVKRASFWKSLGVRPQNAPNPLLECEGWKCDCRFIQTDEPLSRGAMPSLP